jgi:hypothetical protein
MQNPSPLTDVGPDADTDVVSSEIGRDRVATIWVAYATRIIGAICLALALLEWAFRSGHYRPVLALLTVAMFAAILHSYTFEDGI